MLRCVFVFCKFVLYCDVFVAYKRVVTCVLCQQATGSNLWIAWDTDSFHSDDAARCDSFSSIPRFNSYDITSFDNFIWIGSNEQEKGWFALHLLIAFTKAVPCCASIILCLGHDKGLCLLFRQYFLSILPYWCNMLLPKSLDIISSLLPYLA